MNDLFDPNIFYDSYPSRVILRPGYPARAQYKSTFMWDLYGQFIMKKLGKVETYADIGGCFGFSANAMAFNIASDQDKYPETKVFEIASDFVKIGKQLFPNIDFIQEDFSKWSGNPEVFDLVTLFDVIEHLNNPKEFLSKLSFCTKFALLKTPMETTGDWKGGHPLSARYGSTHPDGHVNFFTPKSYFDLLLKSDFEIVQKKLVGTILPLGTHRILFPEEPRPKTAVKSALMKRWPLLWSLLIAIKSYRLFPYEFERKYRGGGDSLCLIKSKKYKIKL